MRVFNLLRALGSGHRDLAYMVLKCLYLLLFSGLSNTHTGLFVPFDHQVTPEQEESHAAALSPEEQAYLKGRVSRQQPVFHPSPSSGYPSILSSLLRMQLYPDLTVPASEVTDIFNLAFLHNYQTYLSTCLNLSNLVPLLARLSPDSRVDSLLMEVSTYLQSNYLSQLLEKESGQPSSE